MAERSGRAGRPLTVARVVRVERVTPHMIRVVLGGDGLAGFRAGEFSDHYVKLRFGEVTRTYTVRAWDAAARELTLDFVHHGDHGLAGPWAANARPGDEIAFAGPGGAYLPDPAASWHLLAGDESALPAIAASLERLPDGARARVFLEVEGPAEEQKLETRGAAEITWLHRGDGRVGSVLVPAVTAWTPPDGDGQAFVHGEAGFVKELRRLLLIERNMPRDRVSISGYWRLGHDEDRWQATKRDWNREVELEQDGPAA
ncbi:siderophore-interacting protein [Actinocorallia lasiicapitis]